ncbi:MAG TPA: VOC family protein [Lacunisphaera sp.]|jgi:predicted enzyme related to lactoylglutathione lyase|nr:VOC family protein [Lacunisphaera sp.]
MPLLKGLRAVTYRAADLAAGKAWFARAFSLTPYFDEPFYVGYNVGGFELGLSPDGPASDQPAGVLAYWGVDDVGAAFAHLLALGATSHEPPKEVGGGITVATVIDPFGNIIGLIENPHFDPRAVR